MFLQYGETIHHPLPWGIPLWDPSHVIFFGVLYLVLTTIGIGLTLVFYRTLKDLQKNTSSCHKDTHSKNHDTNEVH